MGQSYVHMTEVAPSSFQHKFFVLCWMFSPVLCSVHSPVCSVVLPSSKSPACIGALQKNAKRHPNDGKYFHKECDLQLN